MTIYTLGADLNLFCLSKAAKQQCLTVPNQKKFRHQVHLMVPLLEYFEQANTLLQTLVTMVTRAHQGTPSFPQSVVQNLSKTSIMKFAATRKWDKMEILQPLLS